MKYRLSFVTNSSSSAFLIAKKYLSEKQMEAIRFHSELGQKLGLQWAGDSWIISENDDFITGDTYMDNFNISELFQIIGIPSKVIFWDSFGFDLDHLDDYLSEEQEEVNEDKPDWERELEKIQKGED